MSPCFDDVIVQPCFGDVTPIHIRIIVKVEPINNIALRGGEEGHWSSLRNEKVTYLHCMAVIRRLRFEMCDIQC